MSEVEVILRARDWKVASPSQFNPLVIEKIVKKIFFYSFSSPSMMKENPT